MKVGYAWILESSSIKAIPLQNYAEIRSVSRLERIGNCLAVPESVAPQPELLQQVLFAIKHEGINLAVLSQALPLIPEPTMRAAHTRSPTSQYIRKVCFLWEGFTGQLIQRENPTIQANYVPLFDPKLYITSTGQRNQRWRVLWNGIGCFDYCVTVQKTRNIELGLHKQLLQKAGNFASELPAELLNRALAWAYLDETRSSYAIEKELPTNSKANRFVALLKQAHNSQPLTEDYLVNLQNATIDNPFVQAASFRGEQNYLSNGLRGAIGVSYIPPAPELAHELMQHIMHLANEPQKELDPIILATVISFAFVYVHPFMDGNGRLSRFLFHQVLCQQGALKNGLILPVSAALKKNELRYKETLEYWSALASEHWQVEWADAEQFTFTFLGHHSLYRYWDATYCAEFMFDMVEQALEQELKQETQYLQFYDTIYKQINQTFDVVSSDLANLVMFCIDQQGKISANRRKQYLYKVPEGIFDAIELTYQTYKNADKPTQRL